jgi:hypothetical protein
MYEHTALLGLPDILRADGINVVELGAEYDLYNGTYDWKHNKQGYYWVNENDKHFTYSGKPNGWVWHHTATSGYTPNVRNRSRQTKACMYMGLLRGDRLYQSGGGIPTVVFASAGPANYGNGSGVKTVLTDFVADDDRFFGPQRQSDDYPKWYGNRYYGCTEIVHAGDGSPLDQNVFRMAYKTMALMSDYFVWSPWRHIGHLDHTRRKIDPRFEQGAPYTMGFMQDVAQGYQSGVVVPPTPAPPEPEGHMMNTVKYSDGFRASREKQETVKSLQIMLASRGFADDNTQDGTCAADGQFGRGTERSVKAFQLSVGQTQDGICGDATWTALEGW